MGGGGRLFRTREYVNCKCRKRLIDKLAEECNEDIDGNEMIYNTTLNKKVCNFCTIYTVLFVIAFLIIVGITSAFICYLFSLVLKKK